MLSCFPPLPVMPCCCDDDDWDGMFCADYDISGIDEVSSSPANGGPVSVRRLINYAANGSPIISVVHQLYTYALVLLFTNSLAIPFISSSVRPRQLLPLISATIYYARAAFTLWKSLPALTPLLLLLLLLSLWMTWLIVGIDWDDQSFARVWPQAFAGIFVYRNVYICFSLLV